MTQTTAGSPGSNRLTAHASIPAMPVALTGIVSTFLVTKAPRSICWTSCIMSRNAGPAEYLVTPRTRDELARVVAACAAEKMPLKVLGVGTNLLVRDEGVSGVIVRLTAPEFTGVTVAGKTVKAGGGATLFSLIGA